MRYFLDTEYNGWGGALLSLALVPEDGGQEFYVTLDWDGSLEPWVETNVVPFLDAVPEALVSVRTAREEAARSLSAWLLQEHELQAMAHYPDPVVMEIVADWPEDVAQFCMLLVKGPGARVDIPQLSFTLVELPGFSTAANSKVPHNALHDARALRDHVLGLE
ncbi:MAG TPA: hypothetical protein VN640_01030 [Sphingomicrobium sp.]|jgi:hypothetical protein|nr:hypothetical protein [Sphingomicrobium sp.]